jgi:LPXTG-motif cell wall-anchored protein
VRTPLFSRALAALVVSSVAGIAGAVLVVAPAGAATEATICSDAAVSRVRTEIDTDLVVDQFDPALGTLLGVTVTGPAVDLDTDAVFESLASSSVVFSEQMTYQVVITSPGGLASPPPITGGMQRVPSTTLAAFDGTLDFAGASAVSQPSMAISESAAAVSSTDGSVLAAFTGTATMPFHVASTITETFVGGGGNVQAQINTFIAASVEVCYRYAVPDVVTPPSSPPPTPPDATPAPPTTPVAQLARTGVSNLPLAVVGIALIGAGAVITRRFRAPRPKLELR